MSSFRYHDKIIQDYPNLVAGVIVVGGMRNPPTSHPICSKQI